MTVHLKIAEAGKKYLLKRQYPAALERFRAALQMALQTKAPPVFAQHYTDCILDALEASGAQAQALELVERALDEQAPDVGKLGQLLRAHLQQRRVLLLFSIGREADADAALAEACALGGPILKALAEARRRRLTLSPQWIDDLKRKHGIAAASEAHLRRADATEGEEYFNKEFADG